MTGRVLEIGPGRGVSTERLAEFGSPVSIVELDGELARGLRQKFPARRVHVVQASGAQLPYQDASFDVVVCTTMLHHIPTSAIQDELFADVRRVLRPGGIFTGSDSVSNLLFRLAHINDDMTLVDPVTLPARLDAAGFSEVHVRSNAAFITFRGNAAA
jgi:ubiquinone/menaquinone biosynthesis C-methylase UbiE